LVRAQRSTLWESLRHLLFRLQEETSRVEDVLSEISAIDRLLACFVSAKANSFENLLDPFLKICRLSTTVVLAIPGNHSFFTKLAERLTHPKAVVRLNLLRILRTICDTNPERMLIVERYGFHEIVRRLSQKDAAVLVRELAREILPFLVRTSNTTVEASADSISPSTSRSIGGIRRKLTRRSASEASTIDPTLAQPSKPRRLKPKVSDIGWQGH
jgi:hypothetical protein